MITEDMLGNMATKLADRLGSLLDRMDTLPFDTPAKTDGPACVDSGLEFVADPETGWPLTRGMSRRAEVRERFRAQIALCDACGVREACLERAEPIGIWGGLFPHERRSR